MPTPTATPDNRSQLLSTARSLFTEHGYDRTSVDAILKQAGLSKGTFYHYFAAKDELLDSVTRQAVEQEIEELRDQLRPSGLTAVQRLNIVFTRSRIWRLSRVASTRRWLAALYRLENAQLLRRWSEHQQELLAPVIAEVLDQGNDAGSMAVMDTHETAPLLVAMLQAMRAIQAELLLTMTDPEVAAELIGRRVELYLTALERVIGMPEGRFTRPDPGYLQTYARVWWER
ncbi:TetR/AcrR family transcriptional regulator [bacterium]|nr:TetR/AcrR family transcriptional regulator [bacterium]